MKKNNFHIRTASALVAAIFLCPVIASAQAPDDADIAAIQQYRGTPVMPDADAMDAARGQIRIPDQSMLDAQMKQLRQATEKALGDESLKHYEAPVPDRSYAPATQEQLNQYQNTILNGKGLMGASTALDSGESLTSVIQRYQTEQARAKKRMESDVPDIPQNAILVFVSFSMPDSILSALAKQARVVGATLVLRGMKDDTLAATKEAAREVNKAGAEWQINPGMFESFNIQSVPTFVVTGDKEVLDRGCPLEGPKTCTLQGSFASVRGDMSIELALETIRLRSSVPYIQGLAEHRLALLAKKRNS